MPNNGMDNGSELDEALLNHAPNSMLVKRKILEREQIMRISKQDEILKQRGFIQRQLTKRKSIKVNDMTE